MRRCKLNDKLSMVCLVLALSAAGGYAQTNYYKADNGIKLSLTDSWVGGVVPSAGDRVWFSGNTANRSSATGIKNYNWVGIVVTNSAYNWTITGRNIKVGSEGINLAAGNTGNFTLPGVRLRGHQTWNVAEAGSTLIVNGGAYVDSSISGDSGNEDVTITKTGAGTVELNETSNEWNGDFVVNGGTVNVGADNVFGGTGTLFLNDGTRLVGGGKTQTNRVAVSGNVRIDRNCVLAGNLSGDASSSITHEDGSNVAFSLRLGGDNSGFSGTITNNAVLAAENRNSFGTGNLVLNDGSSLAVQNPASLTGADALANDIELNGTVMLGASSKGGDMEFAGDISGDGGFAMTVLGGFNVEVTLSGDNTYAGDTDVADGNLIIDGNNSGAFGTITVTNGSALGGSGTVGGDIVLLSGSKLLFSSNSTLTANGSLVDLGTLGVADVLGLDVSVEPGTYAVMDGTASFDFSDVENVGVENAVYFGRGKSAYFVDDGGLSVVITLPDPVELWVEPLADGTKVAVSWTKGFSPFEPETVTDLTVADSWSPVGGPILIGSNAYSKVVSDDEPSAFFRLYRDQVDNTTLYNKSMMGYQGWFNCPGDGTPVQDRWSHWAAGTEGYPALQAWGVDYFPDVSEYAANELYDSGWTLNNGDPAYLFSSADLTTVERHCRWMWEYDIDGVFLQRFLEEAQDFRFFTFRNTVTENIQSGCEQYGRLYAIMYDVSGVSDDTMLGKITNDWNYLVGTLDVTNSPSYSSHNGKPVVAVWGLGFADRGLTTGTATAVINFFKDQGMTVMGGVPSQWRTGGWDADDGAGWNDVYLSFDILSPWTVGRYETLGAIDNWKAMIDADLAATSAAGVDYMPVIFPGFSWKNIHDGPLNQIPRLGGEFYWRQAYNALDSGCSMLYTAMFDEMDEGTAMLKMAPSTNELPAGVDMVPLNADGIELPSDWYLQVGGEAARMLRGEIPLQINLPISP